MRHFVAIYLTGAQLDLQAYSSVDPRQSVVPFDDFLRHERNFAAVILRAESSQKNELLKLLFVNSTARAVFVDDTFPMAQSEQPALFFQSPDPGRVYAVFEFFHDLLSQQATAKHVLQQRSLSCCTTTRRIGSCLSYGLRHGQSDDLDPTVAREAEGLEAGSRTLRAGLRQLLRRSRREPR